MRDSKEAALEWERKEENTKEELLNISINNNYTPSFAFLTAHNIIIYKK